MITAAFTCTGPYAILIMLGFKRVAAALPDQQVESLAIVTGLGDDTISLL